MTTHKLMIGSDPELTFEDNGALVRASQYLPNSTTAQVGCDGRSSTAELRPRPDDCPLKHTRRIGQLLQKLNRMIPASVKPVAGSGFRADRGDPTGGHIHFQLKDGQLEEAQIKRIVYALDAYVAPVLLVLSNGQRFSNRMGTGYGVLGSRDMAPTNYARGARYFSGVSQHHGVEWRSPPSWLVSQGFSQMILSLAYVVAHEAAIEGHEAPRVTGRQWNNGNKEAARLLLPRIFSLVKEFRLATEYMRQISALQAIVQTGAEWGEEKGDLLVKWGIRSLELPVPAVAPPAGRAIASSDLVVGAVADEYNRDPVAGAPNVYIYGLADHREPHAIYFSSRLSDNLPSFFDLEVHNRRTGSASYGEGAECPIAIGLSHIDRTEGTLTYLVSVVRRAVSRHLESNRERVENGLSRLFG